MQKPKVVVIVGPTSSGKTSLSIKLAKKYNGEVISADSRQIYKGLDIGTGKVTEEEMRGVTHHLLDIKHPDEQYSVADFVRDGTAKIVDIVARNKVPVIAGGTFLYIDALLGRVSMPEVPPNDALRKKLEKMSARELEDLLKTKDPERVKTIDVKNKRRLIRALEIIDALATVPPPTKESPYEHLIIGIEIEKEGLKQNIQERLEKRLDEGMIDEVTNLLEEGVASARLSELGIEYKYVCQFLKGTLSKDAMRKEIETKSLQYAKRQMTWLKRDKEIHWVKPTEYEKAESLVAEFLKN